MSAGVTPMGGTHCDKPYTCGVRLQHTDALSGVEGSAGGQPPLRDATAADYDAAVQWIGPDPVFGNTMDAVRRWATDYSVDLKQKKLSDMLAKVVRDGTDDDYDAAVAEILGNQKFGQAAKIMRKFFERGIVLEKSRLYRALNAGIVETPAASSQSAFIPRPAVRPGPGRPTLLSSMGLDFLSFCIGSSQCLGNSVPDGIDKELMRALLWFERGSICLGRIGQ